jgi:hypothetical protein
MVQHCLHNETRVVMRKLVFYFHFFLFMHACIDCYPLSIFLVVPLHTTDMLFLRINNLNFIDILLSLSFFMNYYYYYYPYSSQFPKGILHPSYYFISLLTSSGITTYVLVYLCDDIYVFIA